MVLFAVEASAGSSGRPCGVYMFSGLTTQVFYIIMLQGTSSLVTFDIGFKIIMTGNMALS